MKISKKLLLLFIPAMLFISSCGLFKGGQGGGKKCDCPKFSELPAGAEQTNDADNS